jgi:Sulfotransferase family
MGHGASGTTLLGNLLNELDGFFHPGEVRTLWSEGLRGLQDCGCGVAVPKCDVWMSVLEAGFGPQTQTPLDVDAFHRWHREVARVRRVPRLIRLRRGQPSTWPALARYVVVADRLYRAMAMTTGARVVVDTSKSAGDAALLHLLPGITPYYLHMVRDPRAVLYSWRRRDPGARTFTTLAKWCTYSLLNEAISTTHGRGRSMLIRFEDFLSRPEDTLGKVLGLVGQEARTLPFIGEDAVELSPNHTVAGHWVRSYQGRVELWRDEEWRTHQPRPDRMVATLLTLPFLARYRYPLRV